jgi:quinoprotein dehydrogenase-associated probable ABC transporter substrate-binding protein
MTGARTCGEGWSIIEDMKRRGTAWLGLLLATSLAASAAFAQPQPGPEAQRAEAAAQPDGVDSTLLKVCADAHNLPQSNDKGEGYENEIAQALARDLKRKVVYTWFPQRMGFVRNTLRAVDETTHQYKCDVIIGVPKGYELTATTQPYMRSTYAFIAPASDDFRKLKHADEVLKLPAQKLHSLRIGIFAQTPAADWLLKNGLLDHASLYAAQSGDPQENPQSVVGSELGAAKIDAAIVWGPVAGYLVSRHQASGSGTPWVELPFKPDPAIKFDYEMAMGVRQADKEWKNTLDGWIASHQSEINKILAAHNVPLLDAQGEIISAKN